jgi:hypothetical protein
MTFGRARLVASVLSTVMHDPHFSCTQDATNALSCTAELQLLLTQPSLKRRRVSLSHSSALDSFVDDLSRIVVVVVEDSERVCASLSTLSDTERCAALYALLLLKNSIARTALDHLLTTMLTDRMSALERTLIESLRMSSLSTAAEEQVQEPSQIDFISNDEIDQWLSGAVFNNERSIDDVEVDDQQQLSDTTATQFVRENVYELNKAMAADELVERLEPIRRQLAAVSKSGCANTMDWTPLLRVVESGADIEQMANIIEPELKKCSIDLCAALLAAFCDADAPFSFSLASKSAFLERIVAARIGDLDRVAPRVLVTTLQLALQSAHARACTVSLLAPVLARGGSAQAELVGRMLKEKTLSGDLCNEFLERFLARDSVVWSDFTFAALQGVLDKNGFRLTSGAVAALCRMLVSLAAAHRGSLKFATLLFRLVSKHGADVPRHELSELTLVAQQCDNFMGKAAVSSLATLRAACGEAPRS